MTSSSSDILHNSHIYYQFKNEKRKNSLILDESDKKKIITVNEVKEKIAQDLKEKQKVTKLDFDLVIYGENSNNSMTESEKIFNGQTLLIDKIPWYKLGMEEERHKNDQVISEFVNKGTKFENFNIGKLFGSVNDTDKLLRVFNENIIKTFKCRFCDRFEDNFDYCMTRCCGETGCSKCITGLRDKIFDYFTLENLENIENEIKNKNNLNGENISKNLMEIDTKVCPLCCLEIDPDKYIMPNRKISELKDFMYELKSLKIKRNNLKINLENPIAFNEHDKLIERVYIKQNISTSNTTPTSLMKLTPSNYIQAGINHIYNSNNSNNNQYKNSNCPQVNYVNSSNYNSNDQIIYSISNPHFPLFENSRFFIIKSYCKENIEISQLHNEWATTVANQKKLNESFKDKNVILIFSANKSGVFQGYAIMKNYIGDKTSGIWNLDYSVKIGGNFKVQWLCSCEYPFGKLKYLTNPLNNNEPLIKSRDTQEITKELGIQVCHLLYEQEKLKYGVKPIFDNAQISEVLDEIKKNREKGNYELMTKNLASSYGQEYNSCKLANSRKSSYDDRQSILYISNSNILGAGTSNIYQNLNNYYQNFYPNTAFPKSQAIYYPNLQTSYYKNYLHNYYRYTNIYKGNYYKNIQTTRLQKKRKRRKSSSNSSSYSDSDSNSRSSSSSSSK